MDTIFAEATPPGRGGVSVIRISGPQAKAALEWLAGPVDGPRMARVRSLREGDDLIDQALVIWFQQGQSFTGEEVAELHLHGAPVIGNRVTSALLHYGLRRAEAGEFSRRAFVNGRMNLAEIEGLSDLLEAETEAQRKLAMRAVDGEIGRIADGLRKKLVRAGALIEASIDFADEDVPEDVQPEVFDLLAGAKDEISGLLTDYPATERLRQGYEVAILGPPNAGKSTLLNRIAKREIALVSEIAGTTRDILELRVDLRGLPVTFLDTAGLRDSQDPIEAMGVERARQRARNADLRIHLSVEGKAQSEFHEGDLVYRSKADMTEDGQDNCISGLTGKGVAGMLDCVYDLLRRKIPDSGLVSHRRQAEALDRALAALDVEADLAPEFLAEAVRTASHELEVMVGRIDSEDYLDEIFSSFCIGK